VVIAWERGDLFVDLITNEAEPIRRLRFSLSQLVAVRMGMASLDASAYPDRSRSLGERLRMASESLSKYGSDFLAGDKSLRPQIVREQVTAWLLDKYDDVIVKGKYPSIEAGCEQLAWELRKQVRIPEDLGARSGVIWAVIPEDLGTSSERSDGCGAVRFGSERSDEVRLDGWLGFLVQETFLLSDRWTAQGNDVGVVDHAVADGVGHRRIGQLFMPALRWDLGGHHG